MIFTGILKNNKDDSDFIIIKSIIKSKICDNTDGKIKKNYNGKESKIIYTNAKHFHIIKENENYEISINKNIEFDGEEELDEKSQLKSVYNYRGVGPKKKSIQTLTNSKKSKIKILSIPNEKQIKVEADVMGKEIIIKRVFQILDKH